MTGKRNSYAAERYCDAVRDSDNPQPCEYGHFGCALRAGGDCENAVFAEHSCARCGHFRHDCECLGGPQ